MQCDRSRCEEDTASPQWKRRLLGVLSPEGALNDHAVNQRKKLQCIYALFGVILHGPAHGMLAGAGRCLRIITSDRGCNVVVNRAIVAAT